MSIDWTPVLDKLNYPDEASMWADLYTKKGLSVTRLAVKLDVSRNTIRAALERHGIEVRQRGGPNNQKLEITDELIAEIKEKGIATVAKRLGLNYTTIYKRLYKARGLKKEDLTPPEPPATP